MKNWSTVAPYQENTRDPSSTETEKIPLGCVRKHVGPPWTRPNAQKFNVADFSLIIQISHCLWKAVDEIKICEISKGCIYEYVYVKDI